jgi:hypothetical protein
MPTEIFRARLAQREASWRYQLGAPLHGTSPTTYMIDGRQHLLVPSGTTLTAWVIK